MSTKAKRIIKCLIQSVFLLVVMGLYFYTQLTHHTEAAVTFLLGLVWFKTLIAMDSEGATTQ